MKNLDLVQNVKSSFKTINFYIFFQKFNHKTKSSFVLIDGNLISSLIKSFLIITVDVPISQDFNKSFNFKKISCYPFSNNFFIFINYMNKMCEIYL